jgi:hypothetical protein
MAETEVTADPRTATVDPRVATEVLKAATEVLKAMEDLREVTVVLKVDTEAPRRVDQEGTVPPEEATEVPADLADGRARGRVIITTTTRRGGSGERRACVEPAAPWRKHHSALCV